jgi:hypothetical protein
MKIAVTLSGIERNFEKNNLLHEFVKQNNVDVHVHTWMESDKDKIYRYITPTTFSQSHQNESYNHIQFKEKKYINVVNNHHINYPKMTFSLNKVISQLEEYENNNNIEYDIIIRTRFDLSFKPFNFLSFENSEIICPNNSKAIVTMNKSFKINDAIFYGKHACKLMHKCYDSISECYDVRNLFHSENLFGTYSLLNKLSVKYQDIEYSLIR